MAKTYSDDTKYMYFIKKPSDVFCTIKIQEEYAKPFKI